MSDSPVICCIIISRWQVRFLQLFVFFPAVPFFVFLSCCPCIYVLPYLAADAALKEEHVIDGRTIDVKRAVPRDRAPLPRLVRVMARSC